MTDSDLLLIWVYRVNGYKRDNLITYGMVTGMVNCANSLGATLGPTVSGAITETLDFSWTCTVYAVLSLVMVSA